MRAAFAAAGGVPAERVWCTLGSDGAGRATGFGTVRFPDAASAERALTAMQGTALDGRQLLVRLDRRAGVATASRLQKASRKMEAQLAELEGAADEIDPEVQGEIEATMLASEREELRLAQVQILIATPSVHRHGPSTARVPPPPPPRLPSISVSASSQVARVRKVLTAVSAAATAEATARAKTAAAEQSTPRRSGAGRGGASSYTIVVFNVSYAAAPGAARRALYSAMAEASPALRRATYPDAQVRGPPTVRVAADRFGRCRGVATVAARSPAEALEVARALDGVELFGRTLAVRAQYGSRAAVLEMAAEMSGELSAARAASPSPPPWDGSWSESRMKAPTSRQWRRRSGRRGRRRVRNPARMARHGDQTTRAQRRFSPQPCGVFYVSGTPPHQARRIARPARSRS